MHSIEYAFERFSLELSGRASANHIQLLRMVVSAGYVHERQMAGRGTLKAAREGGTCQLSSPMEECDTNEQTETGFPSPSLRTPLPEPFVSLPRAAQESERC